MRELVKDTTERKLGRKMHKSENLTATEGKGSPLIDKP